MTLVTLLIALGLEYFLGNMDRFRQLDWFDSFDNSLETRFGGRGWWDSKAGVLFTLAGPLLALTLIIYLLEYLHPIFMYLLTLVVLVYCMGPDVNSMLNDYIHAVTTNDDNTKIEIEAAILETEGEADQTSILEAFMLRAHERLFGVIFWFIVLDAFGALLFCLTVRLLEKYRDIHGHYATAVRDLYSILAWPSSRLMAVAFSIAGSLRDGLEGWASAEGDTLSAGEDIIKHSGLGAMQYTPDHAPDDEDDEYDPYEEWLLETQALLNRTLIVWLAVLGVATIPGWLA